MPRRRVDPEEIRNVGKASRGYSAETKRRHVVFDSGIDWKPVQHAKMKCNAFCPRSFQDETGCIVLNLLESA